MPGTTPRGVSKAVVLAAGLSSRMQPLSNGHSKAFLRLGGLTLIERCLRTLESLAIEEIIVIAGHDMEELSRHLARTGGRALRLVEAAGWRQGNGSSLAAAEPFVDTQESFVVVTVDHVFEVAALRALIAAPRPAALIDEEPSPSEWREGTKVHLDGGRIIGFGKDIRSSAIDCGAFVLDADVFDAHRVASERGEHSLAATLSEFATVRSMSAVTIVPDTWTDVDTPEDLSKARTRLRRSLGKDGDGPIARFVNRPVSTRISMALVDLPVSADLLSTGVVMLAIAAGVLLGTGHGIMGGIAVQAVSIFDGIDGELARLRLRASPRGAMLDGMLDRVADAAIIAGMGVWALESVSAEAAIWLTTAALTGSLLSMASKDRSKLLHLPEAPEKEISWLFGGRDGRLLVIALSAITSVPTLGLGLVAAASLLSVGIRLAFVMRQCRDGC